MKKNLMMRRPFLLFLALGLAGCSTVNTNQTHDLINAEMRKASLAKTEAAQPAQVSAALLPPLQIELPKARQTSEERFSVSFNNIPAAQFFMSVASGTRYNVVVHPEVAGTITANLRDVTLFDALDTIREVYGYDYKVEGTRIVIKPLTMQTSVFQVNYLTFTRKGSSDTRVSSGSVSSAGSQTTQNQTGAQNNNTGQNNGQNGGQNRSSGSDSSTITTSSNSDFWTELRSALEAIVGGTKEGRSVVVSPQSGVVVIRAMPDELRSVAAYLKATQLSVDRQVILEAKILEVQLNDSYQSGINWASFASFRGNTANRVAVGSVNSGTTLSSLPFDGSKPAAMLANAGANTLEATAGYALGAMGNAANSIFGLAFQTSNFATLITFLESQGNVNVLSSPRISTVNNQKAVLKVGTDEFFVTNVSSTTTTGTATTTTPSVTLQPFFSGVVLDVTPQIDDRGNIILHIHPSVSQVSTVNKSINLGGAGGAINLPLASSNTSETDSIVRGQDGQIIAIGGLMQQTTMVDKSQLPGAGNLPGVGALFRNTNQVMQKRELVILLKPTIVQSQSNWNQDVLDSQRRIQDLAPRSRGN